MPSRGKQVAVFALTVGIVAPLLFSVLIGINARYIPFSNWHRAAVDAATADPEDSDQFFHFFDGMEERWPVMMLEVVAAGVLTCVACGALVGRFARQAHPGSSALVALLPLAFGLMVGRSLPVIVLMILTWPLAGISGALLTRRSPGETEEAEPAPS